MVKKIFIGLLVILLIFPLVSAEQTSIKVKTLPVHKVSVFIYPSGGLTLIESFHKDSDLYGDMELSYDVPVDAIDVLVKVSKDSEQVLLHKFEDYAAGDSISIRLDNEETNGNYDENEVLEGEVVEEEPEEIAEEVVDEEVEITEEGSESNGGITGSAISDSSSGASSKAIYFIIIFVLVIMVVLFFGIRKFKSYRLAGGSGNSGINVDTKGQSNGSEDSRDQVKELEARIKSFQEEINQIKNKDQIKLAEEKLKKDREELEKLRRG